MQNLLRATDPMIIFLEPNSTWFDFVIESRCIKLLPYPWIKECHHSPTLVVPMKFEDLVMANTFTEDFWDYEHSMDTEKEFHKVSGLYKIWNEKMVCSMFLFLLVLRCMRHFLLT